MDKPVISSDKAHLVYQWIKERGGVAVWRSANPENPTMSWTGPLLDKDGNEASKPNSQAMGTPYLIIKELSDVMVIVPKEVARIKVSERLSDEDTHKLNKVINQTEKKYRKKAYYKIMGQEVNVYINNRLISLEHYIKEEK